MVDGLIGIKVGMTQVFDENGVVIPVTVIKAGPCVVVQKKLKETDGYDAVQLGLVEFVRPGRIKKPRAGHFKKAGVPPVRLLREFSFEDAPEPVKVGDQVLVNQVFPSRRPRRRRRDQQGARICRGGQAPPLPRWGGYPWLHVSSSPWLDRGVGFSQSRASRDAGGGAYGE